MEMKIGTMPRGKRNTITDVPGVRVGHCTVDNARHKTGVTVILPCGDDIFQNKWWQPAMCSTASAKPRD